MATKYARAAGGVWGTDATWSTTSNGAADTTKPVAGDTVYLDDHSGNVTVDAAEACAILDCNTLGAYDGTLTIDDPIKLTMTSHLVLSSAMTTAGIGGVTCNVSHNLYTAGIPITWGLSFTGVTQTVTVNADVVCTEPLITTCTTSTTFAGNFHLYFASASISGTQTVTIAHDVTLTGALTIGDSTALNGAFNWNVVGLILIGAISNGASSIIMTGGTWQGARSVGINLSFAGDVTVSGNVYWGTSGKTLTYTSGTITTAGSTLYLGNGSTLNTNGISWNNVDISFSVTWTINSLFTILGTLTLPNADTLFQGTAGWTCATLNNVGLTASHYCALKEAVTYTVTTSFQLSGGSSDILYTLTSSHATTKTIITLSAGATCISAFVNATRIDSSAGDMIYTNGGTITSCFNWSGSVSHHTFVRTAGGETVAVAGITKDKNGTALGSCDCYLFRDNGDDVATYLQYQLSDPTTGAYSFAVFAGSTYFVVAFKGGGTPVMDVTDRTLVAV